MIAAETGPVAIKRWTWFAVLAMALSGACLFSYVAWPGYMTYDSVFALSQAREGITSGSYPPMVSYIWRLSELLIQGQGGMLALQALAVFAGAAVCVFLISRSLLAVAATSALIFGVPALMGPMMVVWKDVLFAGLTILTTAACFLINRHRDARTPVLMAGALLIILSASLRINGLPALLPAIYLLASTRYPSRAGVRGALALSLALTFFTAIIVIGISTVRLPDLKRIETSTTQRYVMFHDLLGISSCMGVQVFNRGMSGGRQYSAQELAYVYHPEHVQKSFGADALMLKESNLVNISEREWLFEVLHHPYCYLEHKKNVTTYMLGLNHGPVFYVTDPSVFANPYGLAAPNPERIAGLITNTLDRQSSMAARPVSFFLLALSGMMLLVLLKLDARICIVLMTVSVLYFLPSVLLLSGADLRYQYLETLAWFVIGVGSWATIVQEKFKTILIKRSQAMSSI